jgi:hypothetical protein
MEPDASNKVVKMNTFFMRFLCRCLQIVNKAAEFVARQCNRNAVADAVAGDAEAHFRRTFVPGIGSAFVEGHAVLLGGVGVELALVGAEMHIALAGGAVPHVVALGGQQLEPVCTAFVRHGAMQECFAEPGVIDQRRMALGAHGGFSPTGRAR